MGHRIPNTALYYLVPRCLRLKCSDADLDPCGSASFRLVLTRSNVEEVMEIEKKKNADEKKKIGEILSNFLS